MEWHPLLLLPLALVAYGLYQGSRDDIHRRLEAGWPLWGTLLDMALEHFNGTGWRGSSRWSNPTHHARKEAERLERVRLEAKARAEAVCPRCGLALYRPIDFFNGAYPVPSLTDGRTLVCEECNFEEDMYAANGPIPPKSTWQRFATVEEAERKISEREWSDYLAHLQREASGNGGLVQDPPSKPDEPEKGHPTLLERDSLISRRAGPVEPRPMHSETAPLRDEIQTFKKEFPAIAPQPRSCPVCKHELLLRGWAHSGFPDLHYEFGFHVETETGGVAETHVASLIRAVQEAVAENKDVGKLVGPPSLDVDGELLFRVAVHTAGAPFSPHTWVNSNLTRIVPKLADSPQQRAIFVEWGSFASTEQLQSQ